MAEINSKTACYFLILALMHLPIIAALSVTSGDVESNNSCKYIFNTTWCDIHDGKYYINGIVYTFVAIMEMAVLIFWIFLVGKENTKAGYWLAVFAVNLPFAVWIVFALQNPTVPVISYTAFTTAYMFAVFFLYICRQLKDEDDDEISTFVLLGLFQSPFIITTVLLLSGLVEFGAIQFTIMAILWCLFSLPLIKLGLCDNCRKNNPDSAKSP